jgi:hypothetical protein
MLLRKGPVVLMLLTAVLTYEGLTRLFPDAPPVAQTNQLQAGTAALLQRAPTPTIVPAHMQVQPVMNPYEAPSLKKKGKHHSNAHAENVIDALDALSAIANNREMSVTAPTTQIEVTREVDFHLVPRVIVLPKNEEAQVSPPMLSNKNMKNRVLKD